ncbi:MAG: hypothetical protein WCS37_10885 [Chloroflexota bacterium]
MNNFDWSKSLDIKLIADKPMIAAFLVLLCFVIGAKMAWDARSEKFAAACFGGFTAVVIVAMVLIVMPQIFLWLIGAGILYLLTSTLVAVARHNTTRAAIRSQERMHSQSLGYALQAGIQAPQALQTIDQIHYTSFAAQVRTVENTNEAESNVWKAIRAGAALMGRRYPNGKVEYYALLPGSQEPVDVTPEEAEIWQRRLSDKRHNNNQ